MRRSPPLPTEKECILPSSKRVRTDEGQDVSRKSDTFEDLESPQQDLGTMVRQNKRERNGVSDEDGMSRLKKNHQNEPSEPSSVDNIDVNQSSDDLTLAYLAARVSEVSGHDETKGKDIAAFLGGTGVGKTTTIDFCCGVRIVKVSGADEYGDSVLDVDPAESKRYLKIGHSSSMTKNIDFLSSPRKNKSSALLFCDMPGSGDDKAVDKILNCIIRSHALMSAQSVCPVLVLKIKDFKAKRFQIARSEIEFVASCFNDVKDFLHVLILVTHAEESENDQRTLGRLRSYLRDMPKDIPWAVESAKELYTYLLSECDKAVRALEKREDNLSNIRVVRPLDSENRAEILDFLENCYTIDTPSQVFRFNLEKDAAKLVDSIVASEYENICLWLSSSHDYGRVRTVLLQMNQVLSAVGEGAGLQMSVDQVLRANTSLYNDIKRVVLSFLHSPLESIDVETELVPLVTRFGDMQVIKDSAGALFSEDWKSVPKLMWDHAQELNKYICLEKEKGSWDALQGCAQRIGLLSITMKCEDAEKQSSSNIMEAIQLRAQAVRIFDDPSFVADAMIDLQKACSTLTERFQVEASDLLDISKQFLVDELNKMVQQIGDKCQEIENGDGSLSQSDKSLLYSNVTKLYKFTRPEHRIDGFLPPDSRSDAEGGFYKKFLSDLKLDQGCSLDRTRPQLLQHYSLLSYLLEVEDDELRIKLQLHMDSLKAQIEHFLDIDHRSLNESYETLFPTLAMSSTLCFDSIDARSAAAKVFNSAITNAAQLLQVDEISRGKLCTARLEKFFESHSRRISGLEINIRQGLSSVEMIEHCLCSFLAFQNSSLPEVILKCGSERCSGLKLLLENAQSIQFKCTDAIQAAKSEECRRIEELARNDGFLFGTTAGLEAYDDALVRLGLLLLIPRLGGGREALIEGSQRESMQEGGRESQEVTDCNQVKCLLQDRFSMFLNEQKAAFRSQTESTSRNVDVELLVNAYNSLLPYARAEKFQLVTKDLRLMAELTNGMRHVEAELAELAEERLDHGEAIKLLRNVNRAIRWKHFEGFEIVPNPNCCLKDARDRLKQVIDRNLQTVNTDLEDAKYEKVAKFLDQCCEADKERTLQETSHCLKNDLNNVKRRVRQICWMDIAQIQAFGNSFERIQLCLDSSLFPFLQDALREELVQARDLVQTEMEQHSKKFHDVLDQVIAKNACYSDCDNALKVILSLRDFLPKHFNDALSQFEHHKMKIKEKFDSIENADDVDLQRLANDVIETMFELNVHGQSNSQIWHVFSDSWHAVRKLLEPRLCKIAQRLRERARALVSQKAADLATQMLNTHDKVRDYALQAKCSPAQFPEATEERSTILDEHMRNVDDFKANLKRGNYKDAVGLYGQLKSETRTKAKVCLEDHIDHLIKEASTAVHNRSEQDKFSRYYEQLQSFKDEFHQSTSEQSLISNVECFLKETMEGCNLTMDNVCAELQKLSMRDVIQPLAAWTPQLEKVRKILKFPSEVLDGRKDEMVKHIFCFGTKIHEFILQQFQDIANSARILQLHLLKKFLDNVECDPSVLKEMEEITDSVGSPYAFRLSTIAAESRQKLAQALESKKAEAVRLVVAGIADKNELAKLLSTLNQAANDDPLNPLFKDVVADISKVFDQKVQIAKEAWHNKEDGWSDQLNTILHTLRLGQDAFQEIQILYQMAINCMEKVMAPLRVEIDNQEQAFFSSLSPTCGEMARKLLHIRSVAGDVDVMHKYTKDAIKRILSKLQDSRENDMTFMVKLGDSLAASDNPAGKSIISENPQVFQRVSNMLYNQHMKDKATLDIKQVIKNLEAENAKGTLDGGMIESLYAQYEAKYNELIVKCIKKTTVALQERKRCLVEELLQQMQSKQRSDMADLLAIISALYSFCKSAQHYDTGADDSCIVRPHEIQISGIIRLLSMDSCAPGLTERLLDMVQGLKTCNQGQIQNHFLEIPTGEGKSIVLGITACIFALKGYHVDCVCYSKYLSARDEKDFRDVFDVLKTVTSDLGNIRYLTFEDLCETHIEGIRENVECVIYGKAQGDHSGPNKKNRVLLIDEADVFFTKRFYGNRHSPGFLLRTEEIKALIMHIWDNRRAWTRDDQILRTQEYTAVVQKFSSIEPLIKLSALSMIKNVQDLNNPKYVWKFNKDGKLGYLRGGEIVPATKFRHQNRTVFAYLFEHENRNPHITAKDLEEMLGIDIKCGDFSYAALPMRYYSMIFGVTGTLNTLSSDEKGLLRTEYNITKETVIPSAYGSKRGRLDFTFENQLHVMVLENEAEWHARIDKEISEAVAVSRPVLACFKNDKALQQFVSSRPKFATAKRLDANLDDSDVDYINGIVANATLPGKVTLLTRKFGRGLDFKPNKESNAVGGVLVIQTFFSSAESEQIQIMGRTARQGEKGSYRLIMCSEHLKDKFGFEFSDDAGILSLKSALDSVRAQTMKEKFNSRLKTKLEADAADIKSWAFAKGLHGPGRVAEKLALLNSLASSAKSMTFILMLDVSGSMEPHYPALRAAFKTFVATLINRGHGADTFLTLIFFDNTAWTQVVDTPVPNIRQLATVMPGGGGTSFRKAFALCQKEIHAAHSRDASRAFTLLFLTDGEDPCFTTSDIDHLTRNVGTHVEAYNSIAFGPDVSAKLEEVKLAFDSAGIRTRSITPSNAQELVDAFATAACDSGLHMR